MLHIALWMSMSDIDKTEKRVRAVCETQKQKAKAAANTALFALPPVVNCN
jgi:hypothetical protein